MGPLPRSVLPACSATPMDPHSLEPVPLRTTMGMSSTTVADDQKPDAKQPSVAPAAMLEEQEQMTALVPARRVPPG